MSSSSASSDSAEDSGRRNGMEALGIINAPPRRADQRTRWRASLKTSRRLPSRGRPSSAHEVARLAEDLAKGAFGGVEDAALVAPLGGAPAGAQQDERGAGRAADDDRGDRARPVARVAHGAELP